MHAQQPCKTWAYSLFVILALGAGTDGFLRFDSLAEMENPKFGGWTGEGRGGKKGSGGRGRSCFTKSKKENKEDTH